MLLIKLKPRCHVLDNQQYLTDEEQKLLIEPRNWFQQIGIHTIVFIMSYKLQQSFPSTDESYIFTFHKR